MLEIRNLTKKYGKTYANDNLNFDIYDGTMNVMLGPNGAGKSTAIKSIVGLLRHQGEIKFDGRDITDLDIKAKIGYVPEIPALYQNLTVGEHIEFVARLYKMSNYREYADELLERFELADKTKKFGNELSKGMQQKLSLVLGLVTRPRFIIFDEPMIGLDPHAIRELKLVFEELKASGASLLVSTHIIDSIEGMWDRTLIMKGGHILANTTPDELRAKGVSLEDLYFELTESKGVSEESVEEEVNNTEVE